VKTKPLCAPMTDFISSIPMTHERSKCGRHASKEWISRQARFIYFQLIKRHAVARTSLISFSPASLRKLSNIAQ